MPVGKGKQQILENFQIDDIIIFFGDKTESGGNDYDIAEAVKKRQDGKVFSVNDWKHTWTILKSH